MRHIALLVLTFPLVAQGPASVASLAKEGYWEPQYWPIHGAMLGKPAPKLEFSGWMNGEVSPARMKGQIVVVDFWATWCGPCKRSIPHNNELAKKYSAKGVLVVGACGGGGEENMGAVAFTTGLAYPTAKASKATTEAWQVHWWPTYAVIDRKGSLRALGLRPDYVERVVDALLYEQPERR